MALTPEEKGNDERPRWGNGPGGSDTRREVNRYAGCDRFHTGVCLGTSCD